MQLSQCSEKDEFSQPTCRLGVRNGCTDDRAAKSAVGRILLQKSFEGSDTQERFAESSVGEVLRPVGALAGFFIARALPFRGVATEFVRKRSSLRCGHCVRDQP